MPRHLFGMIPLTATALLLLQPADAGDPTEGLTRSTEVFSLDLALAGAPDTCTSSQAAVRVAFDRDRRPGTHGYWRPEVGFGVYPCNTLAISGGAEFGIRGRDASIALAPKLGVAYVRDFKRISGNYGLALRTSIHAGPVEFGPHVGMTVVPDPVLPVGWMEFGGHLGVRF